MVRHLISLSLFMALSLLSSKCYADENDSDRNRHWMGRVEVASFNSLDWGVELGVDYRPIEYVGAGVSLCVAGDFGDTYNSFTHNGMFYKTEDLHNAVWLRCALQLQSPALWRNSDGSMRLCIKEDCGITLPVPANANVKYTVMPSAPGVYVTGDMFRAKNHGAKSCFYHFKTSLALDVNPWQIWLGYTWSNMDAYSSVRKVVIDGVPLSLPKKKQMQGIYLGVGYKF